MSFKTCSAVSITTAVDLVIGIEILKGKSPPNVVQKWFTDSGYEMSDFRLFDMSGTCPAFFCFLAGTNVVVGIDGISSPLQVAALLSSLSQPFHASGKYSVNAQVAQDAARIFAKVSSLYAGSSRPILVTEEVLRPT
jgi:hypothetical protein